MKTLSFVIPVYNEEKRIHKTIDALLCGFNFRGIKLAQVIFIDDGSNDRTLPFLYKKIPALKRTLKADIEVYSYSPNKGKGYAVRKGLQTSTSDYTLFFDADMSTPLSEFKKFIPHIQKEIDVIVGTRKNGRSTVTVHQPAYREFLGRGFTLLSQIILNTWVTDFTCGFKAFSRNAKEDILNVAKINRWSYDAELLFLSKKLGYSMQEVPVIWANDNRSKVNLLTDLPVSLFDLFVIRVTNLALKSTLSKKTVLMPTNG